MRYLLLLLFPALLWADGTSVRKTVALRQPTQVTTYITNSIFSSGTGGYENASANYFRWDSTNQRAYIFTGGDTANAITKFAYTSGAPSNATLSFSYSLTTDARIEFRVLDGSGTPCWYTNLPSTNAGTHSFSMVMSNCCDTSSLWFTYQSWSYPGGETTEGIIGWYIDDLQVSSFSNGDEIISAYYTSAGEEDGVK